MADRTNALARTLIPLVAVAATTSLMATPAEAKQPPSRLSKMVQGTSLKAETGSVPKNPLCSTNARQSMQQWHTTGGNAIDLVIPLVQDTVKSSKIGRRVDTPSDQCLRVAIRNARAAGLRVYLKPLLELRTPMKVPMKSGGYFTSIWRGRIQPSNLSAWQKSWDTWMGRYAIIALQEGAYGLTIGTEMKGVTVGNSKRWIRLVDRLHRVAPGVRIGYAASSGAESDRLANSFVRRLDKGQFGVTVWPELNVKGALTKDKIRAGLAPESKRLSRISDRYGMSIVVYEIGARSRTGTHANLADGTKGGNPNEAEQVMLYGELLRMVEKNRDLNGVHTWLWNTDPKSGGPSDSGYTVQGKKARATVAQVFGGRI